MRLLDRIVQTRAPLLIARGGDVAQLPGPADFAAAIAACPLRLVLADPLTRVCASLAYAEGDRLAGCLDLIHIPATRLWVEWLERPRVEAVCAALAMPEHAATEVAGRAGVYLTADPSGRRGIARTFWGPADGGGEVCLAPLATEFDLDADYDEAASIDAVFDGATARVTVGENALSDVLHCLRFRFDAAWAAYYRAACPTPEVRASVLRDSLKSVGTDLPLLFALCLLLSSRMRLPERRPDVARLNRRRVREGRAALLEHVELTVPVVSAYAARSACTGDARRMPRLHHVRGHLVRRGSQVFWRVPHLRGRAAFGHLRARNVTLQFESRSPLPHAGRPIDGRSSARPREPVSPLPGGPP